MKQEQNSYYGSGEYQPIDIIDYYHMDFNIANALKYVIRAGNKPGEPIMKDLDKAKDYLSNFEKRLRINARIMYELRGYYSAARSYVEYIDFTTITHRAGFQYQLTSLGDEHEIADDIGVSHRNRTAIFDLLLEERNDRTIAAQYITETGGDKLCNPLHFSFLDGLIEALHVDFTDTLRASHHIGRINGLVR